jgi:hypothetical protein
MHAFTRLQWCSSRITITIRSWTLPIVMDEGTGSNQNGDPATFSRRHTLSCADERPCSWSRGRAALAQNERASSPSSSAARHIANCGARRIQGLPTLSSSRFVRPDASRPRHCRSRWTTRTRRHRRWSGQRMRRRQTLSHHFTAASMNLKWMRVAADTCLPGDASRR